MMRFAIKVDLSCYRMYTTQRTGDQEIPLGTIITLLVIKTEPFMGFCGPTATIKKWNRNDRLIATCGSMTSIRATMPRKGRGLP